MAKVTILIPNFRTPELTKLCLRLLRLHTPRDRYRLIVIDNGSEPESLNYLRRLDWLKLIERKPQAPERPASAHARALNLGFDAAETPFVLSMHTDTLIRRSDWLDYLLERIEQRSSIAGIGSWKLEERSLWERGLKSLERRAQLAVFPLIGRGYGKIEGYGDNWLYIRSHCALYRTAAIREAGLDFGDGDPPVGKLLHAVLVKRGHEMVFLPEREMLRYIVHVNHATGIFNPQLGYRKRTIRKSSRRLERLFAELGAERLLADESFDK